MAFVFLEGFARLRKDGFCRFCLRGCRGSCGVLVTRFSKSRRGGQRFFRDSARVLQRFRGKHFRFRAGLKLTLSCMGCWDRGCRCWAGWDLRVSLRELSFGFGIIDFSGAVR